MNGITRGDVFYVDKFVTEGSEQSPGRPAIVVSNDMCNEFSPTVEVVYLTTQPKTNLPTHVQIRSLDRSSTALCEQISSVSKTRLRDWAGRITEGEMMLLEDAMIVSLGMEHMVPVAPNKTPPGSGYQPVVRKTSAGVSVPPNGAATIIEPKASEELIAVTAERDLYRRLYEEMMARMLPVKKTRGA